MNKNEQMRVIAISHRLAQIRRDMRKATLSEARQMAAEAGDIRREREKLLSMFPNLAK